MGEAARLGGAHVSLIPSGGKAGLRRRRAHTHALRALWRVILPPWHLAMLVPVADKIASVLIPRMLWGYGVIYFGAFARPNQLALRTKNRMTR